MKKIVIRILFCCLVVICQKTTAQEISTGRTRDKSITPAVVDDCPKILIGGSTIFEDSYKRFNTYGLQASFTHKLNKRIGLTGDAGITIGSLDGIKYTKTQVLGGVSFLAKANPGQKIVFVPHVLAGVANVGSKSSIFGTTYANNNLNFSVAAGTDIRFAVGPKTVAAVKVDYNPTFATGGMKNNIRVGAGIYISLKDCDNIPRTRERPLPPPDVPEKQKVCKVSDTPKKFKKEFDSKPITDKLEKLVNAGTKEKDPRFSFSLKASVEEETGQKCCSEYGNPLSYTQTKANVGGDVGLTVPLWGVPRFGDSYRGYGFLCIYEFECGISFIPKLKCNLGIDNLEYTPSNEVCRSCTEYNFGINGDLTLQGKATASLKMFRNKNENILTGIAKGFISSVKSFFGGDDKNKKEDDKDYDFDITKDATFQETVNAKIAGQVGMAFSGNYRGDECPDIDGKIKGFHGNFNMGDTKMIFSAEIKTSLFNYDYKKEFLLIPGKSYPF